MAYNFEYYAPTKVYFGRGEEKNTGRYIREYGTKNVMLVYGGNSARQSLMVLRSRIRTCGNCMNIHGERKSACPLQAFLQLQRQEARLPRAV